jgi:hypothetical protein
MITVDYTKLVVMKQSIYRKEMFILEQFDAKRNREEEKERFIKQVKFVSQLRYQTNSIEIYQKDNNIIMILYFLVENVKFVRERICYQRLKIDYQTME